MRKVPYWFPYPSSFRLQNKLFHIEYKGGQLFFDPESAHSILLYGACCPLRQDVLDECLKKRIPLIYHRRNLSTALWLTTSFLTDTKNDILEKHILFRTNHKKKAYIARRLLDAKFKAMQWLIGYPHDFSKRWLSVEKMQLIEAHHAKVYWAEYFASIHTDGTRRGDNQFSAALDAVSKFIEGIILRWLTFHRLSPFHGFLHRPESYTALVYDLMEPYRGYVEHHLHSEVFSKHRDADEFDLTAASLGAVKTFMHSRVYVPATKQEVYFQELYHGSVLALRAYLLGLSRRIVLPIPGVRNGGRPIRAGYRMYGRMAGVANHNKRDADQ